MWANDFWVDNFWPTDFWIGDIAIVYDLVLIDGSTNFPITLDSSSELPQKLISGKFTTPIQESYGGIIRLSHNFPFIEGNMAAIGYESPDGEFGEIPAYFFDKDYVKAVIPEGLLDTEGTYWKFNIRAYGTRNSRPFSIKSNLLKVKPIDGLVDESILI